MSETYHNFFKYEGKAHVHKGSTTHSIYKAFKNMFKYTISISLFLMSNSNLIKHNAQNIITYETIFDLDL